jgi:predicted phage tail protein
MIRTVYLYGNLGERFGRKHKLKVSSVGEAVRALCANFPGFDKHLIDSAENGVGYKLAYGKEFIETPNDLHNPIGSKKTIKIIPVITGSGSGLARAIIGTVLVAASFFFPPAAAIGGVLLANVAFGIGLSLALGGVTQLLTKAPAADMGPEDRPSYYFNGPVNLTNQGNAIPIGYGRLIIGSQVISAGLSAEEAEE